MTTYHPPSEERDTHSSLGVDLEPLDWSKNPPNPGDEVMCVWHSKGAGNWYVRRKKPELPTADGSVIVPADGRLWILAKIDGITHTTKRLTLAQSDDGLWYWIGLSDRTGGPFAAHPEDIVPGTWLDTTP